MRGGYVGSDVVLHLLDVGVVALGGAASLDLGDRDKNLLHGVSP